MRFFVFSLCMAVVLSGGLVRAQATDAASPGRPAAATGSQASDPAPQLKEIREVARRLIASQSVDDVAKGAGLLQKANEIEQAAQTSSHWKELLTTLVPVFSTLILAGTLVLQAWQARVQERENRAESQRQSEEAEEKRFQDAVTTIGNIEKISPSASLLNSFTRPAQRSRAQAVAAQLLAKQGNIQEFESLFLGLTNPREDAYLPMLLEVSRRVQRELLPLSREAWGDTNEFHPDWIPADKKGLYDLLVSETYFLSEKLAAYLVGHRRKSDVLNLRNIGLNGCDLRGVDLRGAVLTSAAWTAVDVTGSDLSEITEYSSCDLWQTAWWRAAKIDQGLLDYLEQNCPRRENMEYFRAVGSAQPVLRSEYESELVRLRSRLERSSVATADSNAKPVST